MLYALTLRPENPTRAAVLQALKERDVRLAEQSKNFSTTSKHKP